MTGEREVARIWQAAGFQVRGLEGLGDHLVIANPVHGYPGFPIHCEVKRQERVRLPEWARQAEAEAPQGTIAVVAWRQSRGIWRADLALESLAELAR